MGASSAPRPPSPASVGVSGDFTDIGNSLQSTGGFALAFSAGALDPLHGPSGPNAWSSAAYVANDVSLNKNSTAWPYTITFLGRAVTLIGTAGEASGNVAGTPAGSENGQARVFVDGIEITNQTGIWQSKDVSGFDFANDVLLSWRFQGPGPHKVTIQPGISNVKEGDGFLHTAGYYVAP